MPGFKLPNQDQQDFFRLRDLQCPLTGDTARVLMQYIQNDRNGDTEQERIAEVGNVQRTWIGQIVEHFQTGALVGHVRHLSARSPDAMRRIRGRVSHLRARGFEAEEPSHFTAIVEDALGNYKATVGIECLRIRKNPEYSAYPFIPAAETP